MVNNVTCAVFVGIKACQEANKPVDEETYEVSLDNHGCRGGAKTGRLQALDNVRENTFNLINVFFARSIKFVK